MTQRARVFRWIKNVIAKSNSGRTGDYQLRIGWEDFMKADERGKFHFELPAAVNWLLDGRCHC